MSYGVSIVRSLEKTDCVITALHYISRLVFLQWEFQLQPPDQFRTVHNIFNSCHQNNFNTFKGLIVISVSNYRWGSTGRRFSSGGHWKFGRSTHISPRTRTRTLHRQKSSCHCHLSCCPCGTSKLHVRRAVGIPKTSYAYTKSGWKWGEMGRSNDYSDQNGGGKLLWPGWILVRVSCME